MGLHVQGMNEWLADLRTLPERLPTAVKPVMSRAGVQIKLDWKRRWTEMPHSHIPHLIRAIGYDLSDNGVKFKTTVGVAAGRLQSRLASFIEYGTPTSGPHPAGQKSLDVETPKWLAALSKVGQDLLEGKK